MKFSAPLWTLGPGETEISKTDIQTKCEFGLKIIHPSDRAIAWEMLMGMIPRDPSQWETKHNSFYSQYVELIKVFQMENFDNLTEENSNQDFGLEDNNLMKSIDGDMMRSLHHLIYLPLTDKDNIVFHKNKISPYIKHIRRMERVLYIFGQLNKNFGYMQGFSELICPIYFVFTSAIEIFDNNLFNVEAITFFCFQQLFGATELSEVYSSKENSYIITLLDDFLKLLAKHNPKISKNLKRLSIDPINFALRWFTLLFAQDYQMQDLILIWDSLFAHFPYIVQYILYIGIGHIKMIESKLTSHDESEVITNIQKRYTVNIQKLLKLADDYWRKDGYSL